MAEETVVYDVNNKALSPQTLHVKEEFEDNHCSEDKISAWETIVNTNNIKTEEFIRENNLKQCEASIADDVKMEPSSPEICNSMINENIKIENDIDTGDVKDEFQFCDDCLEYYQDYCIKCKMLVHILNGTPLANVDDRAQDELPIHILEIKSLPGRFGIYTLKIIPEGVRFGPFTGLRTSDCFRKIKDGRFIINEDKPLFSNWMQHINPARNTFEQNLLIFQFENDLYYRSTREIQVGEELLVYFGEEYEDNWKSNVEMNFIAHIESDTEDVYACTYCYLGFRSRDYLAKHKSVCRNEFSGTFSIEELAQCPFCYIYLGKIEYSEYHIAHCCKRNDSGTKMCSKNQEMVLEWTAEEDEILIGFVKNHDCLCNVQAKDYRNSQLKKKLWNEIGGILNKTDIECGKRWAYVRDYYVRCRGKPGSGSSGEVARKRSEQLSFLDALPSRKKSTFTNGDNKNVENTICYLPKMDDSINKKFTEQTRYEDMRQLKELHVTNVNSPAQTSGAVIQNANALEITPQHRKCSKSKNSNESLKLLKQISERQQPPQDENDLFFASMAKIVKKMPEKDRAEIRLKIAAIVSNRTYSNDRNNSNILFD